MNFEYACGSCQDTPPNINTVTVVPVSNTFGVTNYSEFVDTTLGNGTLTLPANPANGETHVLKNIGNGGNILTVDRNGKLIDDAASNYILADQEPVTLKYVSSKGSWYLTT